MPINPERLEKLRDLGLTEYQARVYLTLLDLGAATASQIPSLSRVPRTRIYVTMAQLHEKGLVNIIPESPLKYEPVPISEYLNRKVGEFKHSAEKLQENVEFLSEEFPVMGHLVPEQKGRFEAIYGRRNFRDKLKEMYSMAKEEVIFIGTPKSPHRLVNALVPVLEDKAKKKVKLKFVFPISTANRDKVLELTKYAKIKHTDVDPLVDWTVVDSGELLVSHPVPNDENPFRGDDVSIWTDDIAIVNSRKTIAKELWDNGIDPIRFEPGQVMINSAIQWLRLKSLKIDRASIAELISANMGQQIAKKLKANKKDELIKELSGFWEKNKLGKIYLSKKKPMTIAVENSIDCQFRPGMTKPICMFSENVLKTILDEKLGKNHVLEVLKCKGIGDEKCEFKITTK